MHDTMEKAKKLCELKDALICAAKSACDQGVQNVNTHEMGEVTDMIKDLAEAEEKCWKACYYKKIVESMEEETKREEFLTKSGLMNAMGASDDGRMGYDHYRYASGRFAPKGHGTYSRGFTPMHDMDAWMENSGMYGYQNGSRSPSGANGTGMDGRMGYTGSDRGHRYDKWTKARMGYHESKDASSKERMDTSAREYVVDMAEAIKEVWKDADPALRKEIKNRFVSLTSEMN